MALKRGLSPSNMPPGSSSSRAVLLAYRAATSRAWAENPSEPQEQGMWISLTPRAHGLGGCSARCYDPLPALLEKPPTARTAPRCSNMHGFCTQTSFPVPFAESVGRSLSSPAEAPTRIAPEPGCRWAGRGPARAAASWPRSLCGSTSEVRTSNLQVESNHRDAMAELTWQPQQSWCLAGLVSAIGHAEHGDQRHALV